MKVLVTGNKGYIGSVLTGLLLDRGYEVVGYDTDYYGEGDLSAAKQPTIQIKKDIRDAVKDDLRGIEAVIHLAGLSNDPLGELDRALTEEINLKATIHLAQLAKEVGVKRFLFASSQSIYGVADTDKELEEDTSEKNPATIYARTKWDAETGLKKLNSENFTVVCMRLATVFGASPSLRCDLVLNNLVGSAYTTRKVEIKSDGTPWRPMVHIQDVCHAFIAGLITPIDLVSGESFNIGVPNGNFTVKDLALAAQRAVSGSELVFTGEHGKDSRTYRVSLKKTFDVLRGYYKPEWDLDRGASELVELFRRVDFTEERFRGRHHNRLKQIKHLIEWNKIDKNLRWVK